MKQKFTAIFCAMSLILPVFGSIRVTAADNTVIIDNKDSGVVYDGSWTTKSSENGFYGEDYAKSTKGSAAIPVKVGTDGYYKLYARWPQTEQASQEINIKIKDAKGEEFTVLRDETINGGYWVFVGTYFFTAQSMQSVTVSAADGKEVIFDALRLELSAQTKQKAKPSWFENKSSTQEVSQQAEKNSFIKTLFSMKDYYKNILKLTTVSNTVEKQANKKVTVSLSNPGNEVVLDVLSVSGGNWKKETDRKDYGGDYWVDGEVSANFKQFAKWKPEIEKDGKYEIYMRWPAGENRPSKAKFILKNANFVLGTAVVDQTKNANQWNLIGEYNLYKSDPHAMSLWANSDGITAAGQVKVKFVSEDVPPKENKLMSYERKDYTSDTQDKYNIVLDDNGKFFFTKNGDIYNINGICYSNTTKYIEEGLKYFVEAGGNMIRTYSTQEFEDGLLDYAYEHGIGVMGGISIPKSQDFYTDEEEYRSFVESEKKRIDEFKDHPALVMWSVNNESEGADINGEIYALIEELAAYIKSVDHNHPISTSFAGCGTEKQTKLKALAPSVEILGMNAYRGIKSAYPSSVESGWNAPIMVTEYGPDGTWESTRTSWNAVIEQNNSEKANLYRERHLTHIMNNNKGIGGFAFCLPYAVGAEGTLSWYGFVFEGMRTPIMDEMQYAWSGTYPSNVAPRISSFTANNKTAEDNITVEPGETLEMYIEATDKNNDNLTYHFDIYDEIQSELTGKLPLRVFSAENPQNSNKLEITVPNVPGYYRIYGYVKDGKGNVDVNNIPIYVKEGTVLKTDTTEVEKLLKDAAEGFADDGFVSADVTVHADDNINGMPFTGDGTAEIQVGNELVHIISDVTYQSGGKTQSEVYIGKEKSWVYGAEKNPADTGEWYDITQVFDIISQDKNMIEKFTLDKMSDSDYSILSAEVFIPQFYPYALSGMRSAGFMSESDKPDAYSLTIYISNTTGKIDKVIAAAGYMRSIEKAEYRKLQYTYEYNDETSFEISEPEHWEG